MRVAHGLALALADQFTNSDDRERFLQLARRVEHAEARLMEGRRMAAEALSSVDGAMAAWRDELKGLLQRKSASDAAASPAADLAA
jgi:hypothetical protein